MANFDPHRIKTPEPTATKFRTINYVREMTPKPNTRTRIDDTVPRTSDRELRGCQNGAD